MPHSVTNLLHIDNSFFQNGFLTTTYTHCFTWIIVSTLETHKHTQEEDKHFGSHAFDIVGVEKSYIKLQLS